MRTLKIALIAIVVASVTACGSDEKREVTGTVTRVEKEDNFRYIELDDNPTPYVCNVKWLDGCALITVGDSVKMDVGRKMDFDNFIKSVTR